MTEKILENFSIAQICESGQCFRMEKITDNCYQSTRKAESYQTTTGDRYRVIAGNCYLELEQQGKLVRFDCSEEEYQNFWRHYFDIETDYGAFIAQINPNDQYLTAAAGTADGVRILNQDLWEMIVTFLISQQNNIVRIRRCIKNICEAYGELCVSAGGVKYYAFPTAQALAGLEENALMACNLGYRSKYVVRTAKVVASGEVDLEWIAGLDYKKARTELLKLFGVGEKVADCICLFALHHLDAFPVDTHIRQVLEQHYKRGFPNRRYKGARGVMQQYIFYYELHGNE